MIYNTNIEIISSNKDWTSFRYTDYDGMIDKDDTAKIRSFMKKKKLNVSNPGKLASS